MRIIVTIVVLLIGTTVFGQSFTKRLQSNASGHGSVKIYEDAVIDNLVNGTNKQTAEATIKQNKAKVAENAAKKEIDDEISLGENVNVVSKNKIYKKSYSIVGYRIQIFSGDDSRNSRQKAYALGSKLKGFFPTIPVYTHFYSPRWICRVGDFRSYEEANGYLHQLQKIGGFKEASIVKCKIQVGY